MCSLIISYLDLLSALGDALFITSLSPAYLLLLWQSALPLLSRMSDTSLFPLNKTQTLYLSYLAKALLKKLFLREIADIAWIYPHWYDFSAAVLVPELALEK